jgi:hypothetical protein
MLARHIEPSAESEGFIYATRVLSVPRKATEALVVFPGMGENERVIHAVRKWSVDDLNYLFVAGIHRGEATFSELSAETLLKQPFALDPDLVDGVFTQIEAANTKVQADWTVEMVKRTGVESLALTAPDYHLPRAYGTLLASLLEDVPWKVALIPEPTPLSPLHISPETGKTSSELTPAEWVRICAYQKKGDVATREQLEEYLHWLYSTF